jgi:hypothetical protein
MAYEPVFPAKLQPVALALVSALSASEQWPASQGFIVRVQSERLSAPNRVYYEPIHLRALVRSSSEEARVLALCLGTRHCDGFVREECMRELVAVDRPWVVPFAVQLIGEYVLEIVEVIAAALREANAVTYGEFVRDNPEFMATTRRRVTSYWDCYYRARFPAPETYPGFLALQEVEAMRERAL